MLEFKFNYKCYNKQMESIVGEGYAMSKKQMVTSLENKGLNNINVKSRFNSFQDVRLKKGLLTNAEVYEFLLELLDFIRLGNNISEAIEFIGKTSSKGAVREVCKEILPDLNSGLKLSLSLSQTGRFDKFVMSILTIAEETGNYEGALTDLAEYYKDKDEIGSMIKNALFKPAITMTALLGARYFLISSVIPKIGALFDGSSVEPPRNTRILMAISEALDKYPFLIFSGIVGTIIVLIMFFRHPKFNRFQLKLPILGKIKKMNFQTQFLMSYYLLVGHGVQTNIAIQLQRENTSDKLFREVLHTMEKNINRGQRVSKSILEHSDYFDEVIGHMFNKGERTGTLNEVAEKLYNGYKVKIKRYLQKFPVILDTATLAIGGGILLFIFSGIISPVIKFIDRVGSGRM